MTIYSVAGSGVGTAAKEPYRVLAQAGQYTLDKVTQPVGESLVMTAAGLGVAIPAVMAYNLFGRRLAAMDATLDALAFDLRAYFMAQAR